MIKFIIDLFIEYPTANENIGAWRCCHLTPSEPPWWGTCESPWGVASPRTTLGPATPGGPERCGYSPPPAAAEDARLRRSSASCGRPPSGCWPPGPSPAPRRSSTGGTSRWGPRSQPRRDCRSGSAGMWRRRWEKTEAMCSSPLCPSVIVPFSKASSPFLPSSLCPSSNVLSAVALHPSSLRPSPHLALLVDMLQPQQQLVRSHLLQRQQVHVGGKGPAHKRPSLSVRLELVCKCITGT